MIITLKDKNSVWIAVGTGESFMEMHLEDMVHEDNANVWRFPEHSETIMGSSYAGGIDLNRIRYEGFSGVGEPLTLDNMLLKVVPSLRKIFEECDMMNGNRSWRTLSLATKDRAFIIQNDFTCYEVEDYEVLGNGEDVGCGAMEYYKDLPAVERIAQTFRVLESDRRRRQFPVVMMNTMTKERVVIYE